MKRRVSSWATGRHLPRRGSNVPLRCLDCGLRLTAYTTRGGTRSLRHHPRGKA